MKKNRFNSVGLAVVSLILVSLACSTFQVPLFSTPTAVPTSTSTSVPTATARPTNTLWPTQTPDLAATQQTLDLQSRIQRYVQNGYFASNNGDFHTLPNTTFEFAQINWLNFNDTGYEDKIKNFAIWADLKVSSASAVNYPEYSGCGFAFRYNEDNHNLYTAMVAKDRILVNDCHGGYCYEVGKTHGSGRLGYEGDFKAHIELIVNEADVHFLVEGQLVGEYTLSTDRGTEPGRIFYAIYSGTNRDFGTRCDYANIGLWVPKQ